MIILLRYRGENLTLKYLFLIFISTYIIMWTFMIPVDELLNVTD